MSKQQIRTDTKHMVTAWVETDLHTKVKTLNPNRGAIAVAINEGLKLYLEKQLQQSGEN